MLLLLAHACLVKETGNQNTMQVNYEQFIEQRTINGQQEKCGNVARNKPGLSPKQVIVQAAVDSKAGSLLMLQTSADMGVVSQKRRQPSQVIHGRTQRK